ncbi:type I restriction-modification system specificity subunit [Candidatus Moduliflexus flocculans]|uniref:Type I restriction-modification system specificity subunit n=1 Tax=Candidatus Moduliflexus flocculans TaxID=1499966 RepID=A0A0S6VTT0_9BACT|nr:type I restriction-modification system specificity subunit [Candidatus Moduliflexus flocculans]
MSKYPLSKLNVAADIIPGFAFKSGEFGDTGNVVVKIKDITPPIINISEADKVDISKYSPNKLKKYELHKGDFVIAMTGATIGKVGRHISDDVLYINQRVAKIEPKKTFDKSFVYYAIQGRYFLEFILNRLDSSSAQGNISADGIGEYLIPSPDIVTQQKIAAVLSALDAKIELNTRINAELEAMAKTLYDYWFVQFDFPNADGKPYKSSGGAMVWNDALKRAIPAGWEVGELQDIANITMGQSPPGESYNEEGNGMIFFQGCTDFGSRFPTIRQFTTQPTRFAKAGDILLSVRAPVGTINIAKENCCIGRGLAALNSKDDCISYLFGVMNNLKQIFDRRNVDGTTFGSITKNDLFSLKVLKPDKQILKQYQNVINPVFEKQNKIELENHTLAALRDWLLPLLMNGQAAVGVNSPSRRDARA